MHATGANEHRMLRSNCTFVKLLNQKPKQAEFQVRIFLTSLNCKLKSAKVWTYLNKRNIYLYDTILMILSMTGLAKQCRPRSEGLIKVYPVCPDLSVKNLGSLLCFCKVIFCKNVCCPTFWDINVNSTAFIATRGRAWLFQVDQYKRWYGKFYQI